MFVSKKKFKELEKRVADLENPQSQRIRINSHELMKAVLKESLCQVHESSPIKITIPK